jgi:hypothetical protein
MITRGIDILDMRRPRRRLARGGGHRHGRRRRMDLGVFVSLVDDVVSL